MQNKIKLKTYEIFEDPWTIVEYSTYPSNNNSYGEFCYTKDAIKIIEDLQKELATKFREKREK